MLELLIVITIIAILAALLMPALSAAKSKSHTTTCINSIRQLGIGIFLYAADNESRLAPNLPQFTTTVLTNTWAPGDIKDPLHATNQNLLRVGRLFPYVPNPGVYRCPADTARFNNVPRARSYAMNSWIGNRTMDLTASGPASPTGGGGGYRTFVKESELAAAGPSTIWTISDEDESTLGDGWFLVTMNDQVPFASFPGTRHQRGYVLSFGDGHSEVYKLRDPGSRRGTQFSAMNLDWIRLKQVTTVR